MVSTIPTATGCIFSPIVAKHLPNTEFRTFLILMMFLQALFAFMNGSARFIFIPESLALNIVGFVGQSLTISFVTVLSARELLRSVNLATGVNVTDSDLYAIVLNLMQTLTIIASIAGPFISTCLFPNPRDCSSALGVLALGLFLVYLIYNIFALNREA